ncbi:hypothetical protein CAPTEDRAFT_115456 [Capitella teleta]|uniref:Uncharacterized protein n=1 Tax=Capitella teleta TaxID=283909 RepID=R7UWX9_CAPTE|nr:hypothetical protein CAPTEDRAFT_115456 [Capitella teleta]|eukprot:ELU10839.1 hypothetical protein CAPTEDRAFT_115456 [Capitella teleta]
MVQKILYGGNMSVLLPPESVDVSELRQIPDNQEVFAHSFTEQSIIIEILELIPEEDEEAVRLVYSPGDISQNLLIYLLGRTSKKSDIITMQIKQKSKSAFCLHGQQYVSKFNETSKHTLNLWMGLIRLPQYQSDIIVTFNDPQEERYVQQSLSFEFVF